MALDKLQLQQFVDNMVGFRAVGVAQDEAVEEPCAPEMRSFIIARLGELTPANGYYCLTQPSRCKALAALLHEVADSLDAFTP